MDLLRNEMLETECQEEGGLNIPECLLREAGFNSDAEICIECSPGKIVITPASVLDILPEEVLSAFDGLGVSRKTVERVLEEEAGKMGGYGVLISKFKTRPTGR